MPCVHWIAYIYDLLPMPREAMNYTILQQNVWLLIVITPLSMPTTIIMVSNFPEEDLQGSKNASPWNENHFKVDEKSPKLAVETKEQFHTSTAQGLFACKRTRPDVSLAIAYLTT